MRARLRNGFRILLLAGAIWPVAVLSGYAQQPGQITVQQFLSNPAQILAAFPDGGPLLVSLIRRLTLADHADLAAIVALLANANDSQASAIGSGLAQAALASVTTDQAYAAQIQAALAAANNTTASTAYAGVTGDTAIGAAGTGGAGGGAGGGGGTTGQGSSGFSSSGGTTPTLTTQVTTTPTNFFTQSFTSSGSSASGTTTTTTFVSVSSH